MASPFLKGDSVQVISPGFILHNYSGTIADGPNAQDVYEVELDPYQVMPKGWYGGSRVMLPGSFLALLVRVSASMGPFTLDDLWNDIPVRDTLKEPKCECGGEKCNAGHSSWCPKYKPYS